MVQTSTNAWFRIPRPNAQARLRLFCLPYAGGGARIFSGWSDVLPKDVEVWTVQLPGRDSRIREDLMTSLPPLADQITEAMADCADKPFAILGHSMGSLIGFEVARRIRQANQPGPVHMFVSGRIAPHVPDPEPPIHALPDDEFLEELRDLNGTPDEVMASPELMQLITPILRADCSVCETYTYQEQPPLACPISVYGGINDPKVTRENLEAWSHQTQGPFVVRMFPGDHFFIQSARELYLQMLRNDLQGVLDLLV